MCVCFQMVYRHMGKTGLRISVLSLGAWVNCAHFQVLLLLKFVIFASGGLSLTDDEAYQTMVTSYDLGCNFWDNGSLANCFNSSEFSARHLQLRSTAMAKPRRQWASA